MLLYCDYVLTWGVPQKQCPVRKTLNRKLRIPGLGPSHSSKWVLWPWTSPFITPTLTFSFLKWVRDLKWRAPSNWVNSANILTYFVQLTLEQYRFELWFTNTWIFFMVQYYKCIFSYDFINIFFSLLYCKNTVSNTYNTK